MTEKEVKAFYNSSAWKHKRLEILDRDHHECQDCRKRLREAAKERKLLTGRDRKIWPAEEVHHIKELKEHPELAQRFKERRHRLDEHLKERRPEVYDLVVSLRELEKRKDME